MFHAMCQEMSSVGLDLKGLSNNFAEVALHIGMDGAATCQLTTDYLRCMLVGLPNIYVRGPDCCMMHSLNRVTSDHITKSKFDLGLLLFFQ